MDTLNFIPGTNLDLSSFSASDINQAELLVQQFLQDHSPTLNISKISTLYDIQVRQQAAVYLLNRAMSLALKNTMSLKGVLDNPSLIDDSVVDAILSNYFITRKIGNQATGLVRIDVSRDTVYSVPPGTQFTATSGAKFVTSEGYRINSSPTDAGQIQLYAADSTKQQFYFFIPVKATTNGINGKIVSGTALTPSITIANFITAFAFGNFQNGLDNETNEQLLARVPEALSCRNMVSRPSISSALKNVFPEIYSVSIQGMGDSAMTRNTNNILSIQTGGYADIYVRTSPSVLYGSLQKSANLVESTEGVEAIYHLKLQRDDFPGHYYVKSIQPVNVTVVGTYEVLSETKAFNNQVFDGSSYSVPNKINTIQEGVYSRYQTNDVYFKIEYDAALGADQFPQSLLVSVAIAYIPSIDKIQDFISDNATKVSLSDYLVKAVVPCFVELGAITVEAEDYVDPVSIRTAVFNYVNQADKKLRTDSIISIIKSIPGVRSVDVPISLSGKIYAPNGTVFGIESKSNLEIPRYPSLMVTPETTAFFIELDSIPVTVINP